MQDTPLNSNCFYRTPGIVAEGSFLMSLVMTKCLAEIGYHHLSVNDQTCYILHYTVVIIEIATLYMNYIAVPDFKITNHHYPHPILIFIRVGRFSTFLEF